MKTELNDALVTPVLETLQRVMNMIFLVDVSTSMVHAKIAILNQVMREILNQLPDVIKQHPQVHYLLRCISFANSAEWHIGPDPQNPAQISWVDLIANGRTSTGEAIEMLTGALLDHKMPERGYPPVLVLISDGGNTDGAAYEEAIHKLDQQLWGNRAIRLAIGIGDKYDRAQLEKFVNQPEVGVLEARNAVDLKNYLIYTTITVPFSIPKTKPVPLSNQISGIPAAPPQSTEESGFKLKVY